MASLCTDIPLPGRPLPILKLSKSYSKVQLKTDFKASLHICMCTHVQYSSEGPHSRAERKQPQPSSQTRLGSRSNPAT